MKVFHYKACSTCRKAIKWLDQHEVRYEAVPIVESPPSVAELEQVLKATGVEVKKLFNTSGEVYRAEGYSERLKTMSTAQALQALAANGKLIKRPLVVDKSFALVGFDEAAYRDRFGK
jgi:arsenate reductase (glutaredoxin)